MSRVGVKSNFFFLVSTVVLSLDVSDFGEDAMRESLFNLFLNTLKLLCFCVCILQQLGKDPNELCRVTVSTPSGSMHEFHDEPSFVGRPPPLGGSGGGLCARGAARRHSDTLSYVCSARRVCSSGKATSEISS